MSRPGQNGNPPEKRNVSAASKGGRAGSGGRDGRGHQSGARKMLRRKGLRPLAAIQANPYRDRDATPQRDREGTVHDYGTRYRICNNCGEEGHYAYECRNPGKKTATARKSSSVK